ncbi:MAG: hypothetical protein ABL900_18120 [Burkholderiaceae bacterium]
MLPAAHLHDDTGVIRFWVLTESGQQVGATISKSTLHYAFGADLSGSDALATYTANHVVIDAAVRRRVAAGSIEPVMLRERDVPVPARR